MVLPERRTEEAIALLVEATSHIPFFSRLMSEENQEFKEVHPKLCERMARLELERGKCVVKMSRLW